MSTPFGFSSTAAEVLAGLDLGGKRAIVTGGASGIGIETARALTGVGASVTLAVRNLESGKRAAADISATTGCQEVNVLPLDLSDLTSVTAFTAHWSAPLDILVNNAGIIDVIHRQVPRPHSNPKDGPLYPRVPRAGEGASFIFGHPRDIADRLLPVRLA